MGFEMWLCYGYHMGYHHDVSVRLHSDRRLRVFFQLAFQTLILSRHPSGIRYCRYHVLYRLSFALGFRVVVAIEGFSFRERRILDSSICSCGRLRRSSYLPRFD